MIRSSLYVKSSADSMKFLELEDFYSVLLKFYANFDSFLSEFCGEIPRKILNWTFIKIKIF